MRLIDLNDQRVYTVADLHRDWKKLRVAEPENHADNFRTELLEIMMATVNFRNDLEIIGLTHREVDHMILRLRK
jgi:hypothetical protein